MEALSRRQFWRKSRWHRPEDVCTMNVSNSIKLRFSKLWKFGKLGKHQTKTSLSLKSSFSVVFEDRFMILKSLIVWERTLIGISACKMSIWCLKKWLSSAILNVKHGHFSRYLLDFFTFAFLLILSDLGIRKVFLGDCPCSWLKLVNNMYQTTQAQNFQWNIF